jgi:methylated-DNA-protein-cysteine methyltransferase related protein
MPRAASRYPKIYAVVSRIPKGRVATYGQVAALAGLPRQARLVGYALHTLPADSDVPWHRVVNAAGKISLRADGLGHDELQAHLLRREGVRFVGGAIPLAIYRWQPGANAAAAKRVSAAVGRSAGKAAAPSSRRGTSSSRPRRTRSRR